MKVIRWILGRIILFFDAALPPRQLQRAPTAQAQVDQRCSQLSLYQFKACPFCVKVRRAIRRMGLKIQMRDAQGDDRYAEELLKGGGQRQVPCLRIQEENGSIRWMYESADIIAYLESHFAS
jgi:glutaredoxin